MLDPLKLVIDNLPDAHIETLPFANHPKDAAQGMRHVPFARTLWIEREDFMQQPVKGFHRLVPDGEVRLRGVGIVRCTQVLTDAHGEVTEVHCTLDQHTRHGMPGAERKVKGTIHWVSAAHAIAAEVRLYDRLFDVPDPDDEGDGKGYRDHLNLHSRRVLRAYLEPDAAHAAPEAFFQFERLGYFIADRHDHAPTRPVFNRIVTLRDAWTQRPAS